jgi:hypothetical protein
MTTKSLITILNPQADRIPVSNETFAKSPTWSMAPRLESLDGKTVYLVNQGFGGSDRFMDQLQAWFAANMPTVKIVQRRKTGFIFRDDTTDLWKEIKEKGDAVIMGVGG